MRVGIYGGTFDPPHLGHLILAAEAYHQLGLHRLLWLLTPDPPHKNQWCISPASIRLQLVEAAIADNPNFELSRVDLNRPGPHYAVDAVRIIQSQYPGAELFFLMGGDSLHDLPTWARPQELVSELAGFGVLRRPHDAVVLAKLEKKLPGISAKVAFIQAPQLEVSASDIRQRVLEGSPYRYFVTPPVNRLIEGLGIYREENINETPAG
jgi:nicotinate-nucleotide adenylyltransferase